MPYNGLGVFNLLPAPTNPAVAGTVIRAAQFNDNATDFASAFGNVITRDGQTVITANLPMAGKRFTGAGDAVDPGDFLTKRQAAAVAGIRVSQFTGSDMVAGAAAIAAAGSNGHVIFDGPRTYALTGNGLAVPSGVTVHFESDCTIYMGGMNVGATAFYCLGTDNTSYALTANAAKGADNITISAANLIASGIVDGDWVRVKSDTLFDASSTSTKIGELLQVKFYNTGTGLLTFWTDLQDTYNTVAAATVSKVNMVNSAFTGSGLFLDNRDPAGSRSAIKIHLGLRPYVAKTLRYEKIAGIGVWLNDCIQGEAGGRGYDFWSVGTGYLICFSNACQGCVARGIFSDRVRHAFTQANSSLSQGITRDCVVEQYVVLNSATASGGTGGDAMDTHTAGERIIFRDGVIGWSSAQGVNIECASGSIYNTLIVNPADNGVGFHNESDRNGSFYMDNVHVISAGNQGCKIQGGTRGGTPGWNNVRVSNYTSELSADLGFYMVGTAGQPIKNIGLNNVNVLTPNQVSGVDGIDLDYCEGFDASALQSSGSAAVAAIPMRLRNCKNGTISGYRVAGPANATGIALYINASSAGSCTNITVDGMVIDAGTYVSFRGIVLDNNATKIRLGEGNQLEEANTPIDAGTGTTHRIHFAPYSVAYTFPNIVAGASDVQNIVVPNVAFKDQFMASTGADLQGMLLLANASGVNGVRVTTLNVTAGAINLGAQTLCLTWFRPGV